MQEDQRHRKIDQVVPDSPESKKWSWDLNSGRLASNSEVFNSFLNWCPQITTWEWIDSLDGEPVDNVNTRGQDNPPKSNVSQGKPTIAGLVVLCVIPINLIEMKRCLLLGRKAMTNLDSVLKSRDITLPTKVCLVKAMVFPVVMYGCESWTIKKAKCWRIGAFELWCWRRLLRVPWTARISNQSIRKEISPEYSLEGLMLKLKFKL